MKTASQDQLTSFITPYPHHAAHFSSLEKEDQPKTGFRETGRIALLPILNVALTVVLTTVLIFIYMSADGKPIHYTITGIPIQALVALIITLIKMCLAGGIGYAVSEYKWIQLGRGSRLSLLDVYDGCTRGFGGMVRVMTGMRPDMIIIPTILLQLGLIGMGPASQQILTTASTSYCDQAAQLRYTDLSTNVIGFWTSAERQIQTLSGTATNYFMEIGLDGVADNWVLPISVNCPSSAANCTIDSMLMLHNTLECTPGSVNQTLVISEQDLTVKTVHDYYNSTKGDVYVTPPQLPQIMYGGAMQHRTIYDILNNTVSATGPAGDQVMVIVSNNGTAATGTLDDDEIMTVQECKLVTHLNRTRFNVLGRTRKLDYLETTPIPMDYDLLADNTHWNSDFSADDHLMLNAYAVQVAIMRYLIDIDRDDFLTRSVAPWGFENKDRNTIVNLLNDFFLRINRLYVLSRPEGLTSVNGVACYDIGVRFRLEPAAYYGLSLAMLIPLVWWVFTWLSALYLAGGVSRGNSQVVLLVTGFTAAVRQKFKGLSHADANTVFKRAKEVDIAFGELTTESDQRGHTSFGLQNQVSPARRKT